MYLKAFRIVFCVNGLFISLAHFFLSSLGLFGFFLLNFRKFVIYQPLTYDISCMYFLCFVIYR